MDYIDFNLDICKTQIKWIKSSINTQRCITYLTIIFAVFQFYLMYKNDTSNIIFSSIVLGTLITNSMWCFSQLLLFKKDLKFEKERLSQLENQRDNEDFKGIVKQLKYMREYYEDLINKINNDNGHESSKPESVSLEVGKS